MGLLLLLPGLILLLAGGSWFAGAVTVGWILAITGAVLILLQMLWVAFIASRVRKEFKRF